MGASSEWMAVIAISTGSSVPSDRMAVISMTFPSSRAFVRRQIPRQAGGVRGAEPRRDDQIGERAPNRLGLGVAEGSLGGRVELDHGPVGIHRDDAIEHRVQDGGLPRLALAQRRLGTLRARRVSAS